MFSIHNTIGWLTIVTPRSSLVFIVAVSGACQPATRASDEGIHRARTTKTCAEGAIIGMSGYRSRAMNEPVRLLVGTLSPSRFCLVSESGSPEAEVVWESTDPDEFAGPACGTLFNQASDGGSVLYLGFQKKVSGLLFSQRLSAWSLPERKVIWNSTESTPGDDFAHIVVSIPDIDMDGIPDILVGAPETYFSANRLSGPGYVRAVSGRTGVTIWEAKGENDGDCFGWSACLFRDYDGDGVTDLCIGAPRVSDNHAPSSLHPYVQIVSGKSGRKLHQVKNNISVGSIPQSWFGYSVLSGVDCDEDHVPDLVVGDPGSPDNLAVLSGVGFATIRTVGDPCAQTSGFGTTIVSVDFLGDGDSKYILVGQPEGCANGNRSGALVLLSVSTGNVQTIIAGARPQDALGELISIAKVMKDHCIVACAVSSQKEVRYIDVRPPIK